MNCIFTDELMHQFNWMGQRGSKRGLKSCKIVDIINGKFLLV